MKLTQLASAVILATTSLTAGAATYNLTTVPVDDLSFYNFAQSIDNTGKMVVITESEFNPPIDLDLLDFENETFVSNFDDPDAVEQGVFSSLDYQRLYSYIISGRANSYGFQSLATYRSYGADTVRRDLIPGFDVYNEDFDDYSRSAYTRVFDSTAGDYFVGNANGAFFKVEYTNEEGTDLTYILNDRYLQAFVEVNGETKALPPVDDEPFYGYSEAYNINQNLQVAGFGSSQITDTYKSAAETCDDEESRGDIPAELCYYNLFANLSAASYKRAHVWQLDALGNVISTTDYGMVFTPDEDDTSTSYYSKALAINDNGIAVGESSTGEAVYYALPGGYRSGYAGVVATSFVDGEVVELLPRDDAFKSSAVDINNDNWVTGTVLQENNGYARQQLFIYNIDSGEAIYPDGFFQTAAVKPRAINNNGIVVGEGESESDTQTNRQVRAFMYDINVGEFIDLNTLLPCDMQSEYTLVTAMDINDNNEIIANARYRSPQVYIDGEEVLTDSGDTNIIDRIVAVKLTPTGSSDIDACEEAEEEKYERKGASTSWYGILALSLFALLRRRRTVA